MRVSPHVIRGMRTRIKRLRQNGVEVSEFAHYQSVTGEVTGIKLTIDNLRTTEDMVALWPTLRKWGASRRWNVYLLDLEKGEVEFIHRSLLQDAAFHLEQSFERIRKKRQIDAYTSKLEDLYEKLYGFYIYHRQVMYKYNRKMALNAQADLERMADLHIGHMKGIQRIYRLMLEENLLDDSNMLAEWAQYPFPYETMPLE